MNKSELWADPEWCSTRNWGTRRGRPWTPVELAKAKAMRALGSPDSEIALELERTERSVSSKLGYVKS